MDILSGSSRLRGLALRILGGLCLTGDFGPVPWGRAPFREAWHGRRRVLAQLRHCDPQITPLPGRRL